MKINDFISDFLGTPTPADDIWDKHRLDQVSASLGRNSHASPMLATTTWQTLIASPELSEKLYPEQLKGASTSALNGTEVERYILCLGNNQFCLLVFDPNLTTDEPIQLDASQHLSKASIQTGFENWQTKIAKALRLDESKVVRSIPRLGRSRHGMGMPLKSDRTRQLPKSMLKTVDFGLVSSGIQKSEWPIVVCKPPKRHMTCFHPENAHQVVWEGGNSASMAGVYAYNEAGQFGATVCLHSFPDPAMIAKGAKVTIKGIPGKIHSIHQISDSCFVAMDADEQQIQDLLDAKGPLRGMTPRELEHCTYINRQGDLTDTQVIGWSEDLTYTQSFNQVKVLTTAITNPGDSGSALLDREDNVLGFSFYRTEINAVKEFSAWIWADSVFQAHHLTF